MAMDKDQQKVHWQGEVVSVQPRSTVWRYLTDNRTHRECGYNVFLKGEVMCDSEILPCESVSDKYDFCVAVSEKQEKKIGIHIGDILKGTAWTKKYTEIEFANYYPGPPWTQEVPPLEIYAWRGKRMLSKAAWKGKCFRCIRTSRVVKRGEPCE